MPTVGSVLSGSADVSFENAVCILVVCDWRIMWQKELESVGVVLYDISGSS